MAAEKSRDEVAGRAKAYATFKKYGNNYVKVDGSAPKGEHEDP